MTAMDKLLEFIRSDEGGPGLKGYGTVYSGARGVNRNTDVSKMTLNQVLRFQSQMLEGKSRSTACGGYQFLQRTLRATMAQMGLTGNELWTPALQDRMAIQLMKGRKLNQYLAGTISAETFANNLAMEWASLPVVTPIIGGQKFMLKPGQSFYAGDGLNKARHDYKQFLSLVKALREKPEDVREADPPTPTTVDASKDEAPTAPPKGDPTVQQEYDQAIPASPPSFWAWIKSWFS